MEKYITSIKDLVIQVMSNGAEIKDKAEKGDAKSCFQMGMIHLLGINTPIDFKKASEFIGNQSLSDAPDANRLLGFIAECEGDFSKSFLCYAKVEVNDNDSYISKVIKSRNQLQQYLKRFKLDTNLNNEVSAILGDYKDNSSAKTGACIKIASLCNDEQTCLDAAQCLCETGDYISAMQWLKKGNVSAEHLLCKSITERFEKTKNSLKNSSDYQIIEIEGNSLLGQDDITLFLDNIKRKCKNASLSCSKEWKENAQKRTNNVIGAIKDSEEKARMAEEAEEEARKKKRSKLIKYSAIAATAFLIILLASIGSSSDDKINSDETVSEEIIASDNDNSNSKVISNNDEESDRGTDASGYNNILSERKLSEDDLSDKTKRELEIMRNSIYARYGYKFKREDLLNHFSQYSWYNPTTSDMGTIYNMMNDNEKYNVDFIKKHE